MSNPYKRFTCSWCGEIFNDKKRGRCDVYQETDPESGRPMCEDCFDEHFNERCDVCGETMLKEDHFFVVIAERVEQGPYYKDVEAGYYRVLDYPIYFGPLLGTGTFDTGHLHYLGPLTGKEYQHLENGHACIDCVRKAGLFRPYSLPIFNPSGTMKRGALDTPKWYDLPIEERPIARAKGGAA